MPIGNIRKMQAKLDSPVQYWLPIGDELIHINPLLGKNIGFRFTQQIHCIYCGKKTKKSYSQGYCFPCMQKLAACDICIVRPEQCHFDQGTCREPEWGLAHCMQPHFLYLANSSALKVGITRATQIPTRWIDQGAQQALAIFQVQTRYQVGLLEVAFKNHVADKTNWRTLLKAEATRLDLMAQRDQLLAVCQPAINELIDRFGDKAIQAVENQMVTELTFPVLQYPSKITSLNLDNTPEVTGVLQGIKGQYLILDCGVINMRKYTGYEIEFMV